MLVTLYLRTFIDGDPAREERPVTTTFDVELTDRDTLTVEAAWSGSLEIDPELLERFAGGRQALRTAIEKALGDLDDHGQGRSTGILERARAAGVLP